MSRLTRYPRYMAAAIVWLAAVWPGAWAQTAQTRPATSQPSGQQPTIRFQFDQAPYDQVIERFAQAADMPLIANTHVDGTLTFFDSQPYTFNQALDTLNLMLAMRGDTLIKTGRYLRLVKLDNVEKMPLKILRGLAHTHGVRAGQIVTVVLPLKYINAKSVAKIITPMVSTFGSVAPLDTGKGIVITDRLSNIQRISDLLDQLDTSTLTNEQIRSYRLKYVSAAAAAKIIDKLFGSQGNATLNLRRIHGNARTAWLLARQLARTKANASKQSDQAVITSADGQTNTLFLKGPPDRLAMAEQIIKQLDQAQGPSGGNFRLFQLKNANAQKLAATLNQVFAGGRGRGRRGLAATPNPVKIVADADTNRLLVSAPKQQMQRIEELIKQLDAATSSQGGVKIVRLKTADASQLATILEATVTETARHGRRRSALSVSADPRSNSLVMAGSASALATASSIIEQLDSPKTTEAREIHVVHLKAGNARILARSITSLFSQQTTAPRGRRGRRGRSRSPSSIQVEAEPITNTLLISSTPHDWPMIQGILRQLQIAATPNGEATTRLVALKYANAEDLAKTLSRIYRRRHGRGQGQTVPVVIAPSQRTNSLLISASEQDQQSIAALIQSLDVPAGKTQGGIQVIRLQSADAAQLAASLRAMLPRQTRGHNATIAIQADAATNSVLLRAPADQQAQIEALIQKLDEPVRNGAIETRVIDLKNTSAKALAATLTQLYRGAAPTRGRRRRGGRNASNIMSQVTIAAAPGDRALVVQGPRGAVQQVAAVVASLDTKSSPAQMEVRTYRLEKSQAGAVAKSLAQLFDQQQQRRRGRRGQANQANEPQPRFTADAATNQLLVAATRGQFPEIETLIKKLQVAPTVASQMRTFQLKYANAAELASMLEAMLVQDSGMPAWMRFRRRGSTPQTTRIAALTGQNAIVVQGTPDQLTMAAQLIKTFDTPKASQWQRIELVQLKNADARTLAQSINQSLSGQAARHYSRRRRRGASSNGQGQVSVTAEPNSNTLLVRGPSQQVADVVAMIHKLDSESSSDAVQLRIYPLKHADAQSLARSLTLLFRSLQRQQRQARGQGKQKPVPFSVTANERTNSLVVSTTSSEFVLVEHLITSLDQTPVKAQRDVQYVYLQHADADAVAQKLQEMFTGRRRSDRPVIDADSLVNALTIIASDADMQIIRPVIAKLDKSAADTTIRVRVIPLTQGRAETMADILRRVYRQMGRGEVLVRHEPDLMAATTQPQATAPPTAATTQPSAGGKVKVVITVDPGANALIVAATREDLDNIQSLIDKLSASAGEGSPNFKIFHLTQAEPTAVARTLTSLFNVKATATSPRRGRRRRSTTVINQPAISVVADPSTRSIIVRASPQDLDVIQGLVAQLDHVAQTNSELRVFPLKHAKAAEVAANLQSLFEMSENAAPTSGRLSPQQRRAMALRRQLQMTQGGGVTQVSSAGALTVTANATSNAVIVTAPSDVMKLAGRIIEELDQSAAATSAPVVQIYHLKHADVDATVSRLQTLFAGTATRRRGRRGTAATVPTAITGDAAAKLVIVSAGAEKQALIGKVIADLDAAQADHATTVQVIRLKNAAAPSVAAALLQTLSGETGPGRRRRGGRNGTSGANAISISADRSSNSLVVRADAAGQKRVAALVAQMDVTPGAQMPVHLLALHNADAQDVAGLLNEVFTGQAGNRRRRGRGATQGSVVIQADEPSHILVIRADDAAYARIKTMAGELDKASTSAATGVHVIALKNSDAPTMASTIENLYSQQVQAARRDHRTIAPLAVTADARANAVIVVTGEQVYKQISVWVERLEKMKPSRGNVHILTLEHADPQAVNQAIEQIFGGQSSPTGRRRRGRGRNPAPQQTGVQTTVLPDQQSILVSASDADFRQIKQLVETLDQAAAKSGPKVKVFTLKHANNLQVAQALSRLYTTRRRRGSASTTPQVRIQALRQTNAVVVTAAASDMARISQLIEQLDSTQVSQGVAFRIYPMHNATPSRVVGLLNQLLNQVRRANPQEPITAQADDRTQSIIVSAREPAVFKQIETLVAKLDQAPAYAQAQVRIIALKHADAPQLAKVLAAMLSPTSKGKLSPAAQALQEQVRRLQVSSGKGKTVALLDLTKPIKITADPLTTNQGGSNQLLISSTPNNLAALVAIIGLLDRVPVAQAVRVYPLEQADATRIKSVLTGIFRQRGGRGRANRQPAIAADERTNTLIVSADEQTLATISALLKKLDITQPIALRDMHLVRLENADADTLAKTLQKMMDARVQRQASLGVADAAALKTLVIADVRSNSLIVGGSRENFDLVKDLAHQLDTASPALGGRIQFFPLEHANAGTLSAMLTSLFNQRYQAARTADVRRQKPVIMPDLRTNALLVAATADDTKVIESLLKKLDVTLMNPAVSLKVIALQFNDAGTVAPMLQKLFAARLKSMTPPGQRPAPQDQVDVQVDGLSNALVISASKENQQLIAQLVKKLDVEPAAENGLVQMFQLKHADATQVESMLKQLVSHGLYKPATMTTGQNALIKQREKVSLAADERTNVLIVSASKANLTILGKIIKTLDSTANYAGLGDVRVYVLEHADATRLAPTLQRFFTAKQAAENKVGAGGRTLPVTVFADARTNTLLVAGGRDAFASVSAMIEKLDVSNVTPAGEFQIFYLKRATAATIAPLIQQLFAKRVTRGQGRNPVTVVADAHTNTLIVGASRQDMSLVQSLIHRLDKMPSTNSTMQAFALKKGDANQVAATLRQLFNRTSSNGRAGAGNGANNAGVVVSVDERLNTIVVSGGPADIKQAAALIKQLDTSQGAQVTQVRIFPLKNADAAELATILTQTLTKRPAALPGTNPNRQALLQFVTRTPDGKDLISSALQTGVLIVPDTRTNTLVVSAPAQNMPLLSNLIEALDSTAPQKAQIKVFHLVNADAEQMASVLRDLFRVPGGNGNNANHHEISYQMRTGGGRAASGSGAGNATSGKAPAPSKNDPLVSGRGDITQATLGSAAEYALTVTVDPRTNSILIGGTKHYVDLAATIIKELDSIPAQQRITRVYRLHNAQATDIATALNTFLQQERQRLTQTLGPNRIGAAQRLLDEQAAIVPEKTSNTLLISASPRYFNTLAEMIKKLDEPPPQVLIQVLLAEVTLNNGLDLGLEWNYKFGIHGKQASTGTDFGVAGDLARMGGFDFSITGGNLQLLLRAMASEGRLNVLSRPQILASDNQPASINVGQRVPFITNTRITDNGSIFNTIQYENVGIILKVTPRITSDGAVKMDVAPEISSLSDSTVPIGNGLDAAVINNRSAQTTVTVEDGHTIVIGGLITSTVNDQVKKVPILGDLPLIGPLFRSETHTKERTELLIIMTPHILRGAIGADSVTDKQIGRLDLLTHDTGKKAGENEMLQLHSNHGNRISPALPPHMPVNPKELIR